MSKTTLLPTGEILDTYYEQVYDVQFVRVKDTLMSLSKHFNNNYKDVAVGIYYRNEKMPLCNIGGEAKGDDGSRYIITELSNLDNLFEVNSKIVFETQTMSRDKYIAMRPYLHAECTAPILVEYMLAYIESAYMRHEHLEAEMVRTDPLGISNGVVLAASVAEKYETFLEWLEAIGVTFPMELAEYIAKEYTRLYSSILRVLDDNISSGSVMLNIENNTVFIKIVDSPSLRRVRINVECLKCSKDARDEEDVDGVLRSC